MPGNVMITSQGKIKVLDFGLAKVFGGDISGGKISKLVLYFRRSKLRRTKTVAEPSHQNTSLDRT